MTSDRSGLEVNTSLPDTQQAPLTCIYIIAQDRQVTIDRPDSIKFTVCVCKRDWYVGVFVIHMFVYICRYVMVVYMKHAFVDGCV